MCKKCFIVMIEAIRETLTNQRVGLGLAALGRPGYMTLTHATDLPDKTVEAMRSHAFDMLDFAWKKGIRYFDVARSYGKGEEFLAQWLKSRDISPKEVVIGSKWGYVYTANWQVDAEVHEIKYHTPENLARQWKESQELLGDYLSIYHIHSATIESGVLENTAVLDLLFEIQSTGTVVGLSLTGPKQHKTLEKALTIEQNGQLLFESVQATWNLLEQSVATQLDKARRQGCLIIIKEAMANGRIATLDPHFVTASEIATIQELSARYQLTPDQLAMNAALQQEFADIILSGAATESHLLSNLHRSNEQIDQNSIEMLAELPEAFWETRSTLSWV